MAALGNVVKSERDTDGDIIKVSHRKLETWMEKVIYNVLVML